MKADPSRRELAEAARELERLDRLAAGMHAQLAGLQQQLAAAECDLDGNQVAGLLEANARLVQSALLAQSDAAAAHDSLQTLSRTSCKDPLTGLPNRALLLELLATALAAAQRHGHPLAVVFFDLDHLKRVNDAHGHKAGDDMLYRFGQRLQAVVRHSDLVCRYGGDEFVVVLTEVPDAAHAVSVVRKIMAALALPGPPHLPGESGQPMSASAGIAMFPEDGADVAALIELADRAMYVAKHKGRGGYALHGAKPARRMAPRPTPPVASNAARGDQAERRQLREANTQLVVAALLAQAGEATARESHHRQVQSMAMVAHELRNPLTPIRIAASLLGNRRPGDEPNLPRLQEIIEGQVVHMARLVDDLLEVSRASLGKLRLECSRLDLHEVLERAVETCAPAMRARRQVISTRFDCEPLHLDGDPVRLTQVFCNLLDNASKYSPDGGAITLRTQRQGELLSVTVKDEGAGIPTQAMARIFELFVQDDHALQRDKRGLGIGLAVVRELVHAHGGTVSVHSEGKDQGSEFTVVLPVHSATLATPA